MLIMPGCKGGAIKITLRFHLSAVRIVLHQEHRQQQMLAKMQQNWNTYTLLMWMSTSTTSMNNSMNVPQKLKVELPYNPVICIPSLYERDCESGYIRETCASMFITDVFTITKLWKTE
jgi:hypothetical protein